MQRDSLEISFNFQQSIMNSDCIQGTLCEQSKTSQRQTKVQAPDWWAQVHRLRGAGWHPAEHRHCCYKSFVSSPVFLIWNLLSPFTAAKSCSLGNCSWFPLLHSCSRGRWQCPPFINITSSDNTLPQQISAWALAPGSSATSQDHCAPSNIVVHLRNNLCISGRHLRQFQV